MINKTNLKYILFASLTLISGLHATREDYTPAGQLKGWKKTYSRHPKLGYTDPAKTVCPIAALILKSAGVINFENIEESAIDNNKDLENALRLSGRQAELAHSYYRALRRGDHKEIAEIQAERAKIEETIEQELKKYDSRYLE